MRFPPLSGGAFYGDHNGAFRMMRFDICHFKEAFMSYEFKFGPDDDDYEEYEDDDIEYEDYDDDDDDYDYDDDDDDYDYDDDED